MEEYISKIACDNKRKRLGKISEIRGKPNRVLAKTDLTQLFKLDYY